jgi:hypothetical protein
MKWAKPTMPLASRGEGGTRPPPFNRSRTLGGGERTLAIKTPVISRGLCPRRASN